MNTLNLSSILKIIHRTTNNLSEDRKDHGIRVAYLMYRALQVCTPLADAEYRAILRTAFVHEIGAHEPQNDATLAYYLARNYAPYPEQASMLLNHRAETPNFRFVHRSQLSIAQLFSVADRLDDLLQAGIWNGYDLFSRFDAQRGTVYTDEVIDCIFENGIHLLADEFRHDAAFQTLIFGGEDEPTTAHAYLSALVAAMDFQSEKTAARRAVRTAFCECMAPLFALGDDRRDLLLQAATICDIGAYGLSPLLHEYGYRNSTKENALLQAHVDSALRILDGLVSAELSELVACHHEHPNGTGYPRGLTGDQLSGEAHILSLAGDLSELYCGTATNPERALRISIPKRSTAGSADADLAQRVTPHIEKMVRYAEKLSEQVLEQYRDLLLSTVALKTKIHRYHQQKPVSMPLVADKNPVVVRPVHRTETLTPQHSRQSGASRPATTIASL